MVKKIASDLRFYFGGYDPGTAMTSVSLGLECDALDATSIPDTAERMLAGTRKDQMTWSGLFDDSADAMDAAQATLLGASGTSVVSLLIGTATGDRAYSGTALALSNKPAANVAELVKLEAGFKPDQTWDRGAVLTVRKPYGHGTTTAVLDGVAASTANSRWYIHVFNWSGTGTARIALFQSANANMSASIAIGTFDSISGRMSGRQNGTGTAVSRYIQGNVLMDGTFDSTGTLDCAVIFVRL